MNCWQFNHCGREAGGAAAAKQGVCPAYPNHGRRCAEIVGTLCNGEGPAVPDQKIRDCLQCSFYNSPYYERQPARAT